MTRQELIERIHRQTKRATHWAIVWLVSLFGILGLLVIVARGLPSAIEEALEAAFIVFMLGTVSALMLGLWMSMRRLGLVCPHCRVLLTKDLWSVAVASGRCGKCGEQIVDDKV
jgi:lysylphosphatidylglycerol synthetase-like protein (DUF2156 family)